MFLAWNPFAAIGDTILSFLVGILLFLDALIYSLISWVYQIILVLCNVDILNNNFEINNLVGRIYIILGVIVLFLVAYSLLKSMANPDEALKGKKSPVTIIKDVLISIVLIAIIPSIFEFAYGFQSALLTKNTLGSIILGTSSKINGEEINSEDLINNGGMTIATGVLNAFLHENYSSSECIAVPVSDTYPNGYNCDNVQIETTALDLEGNNSFRSFWSKMQAEGSLLAIVDLSDNIVKDGTVTYYYIISTVAGVFVLFVLLSYCFDIAVRAVKLAVFELIAPLPILARIIPNEQANKTFSNWLKATISTFIEVFIRLAILFFAVLIIKIVIQNFPSLIAPLFQGQAGWTVALFAQMFLIIGIIMFVKQAPGIIKDITGLDGGKYNPIKSALQTASLLGGGATAAVRNFNAKDDNGNNKNIGRRLLSAAGGGVSGIARSSWKRDDVKDLKSMKSNAHNAAEEAIKKRIQRENEKRDRNAFLMDKGEPSMEERNIFGRIAGSSKYKAHKLAESGKDWAGAGEYNSVAISRTKELADKIDANFSAIEGTWKKTQAFIDAKAETEKLSKQKNAMQTQYDELIRSGMTQPEANATLLKNWGTTLDEIKVKSKNAKDIQTEIERAEQIKKAESIATAARNIQLSLSQYSDIQLDKNAILSRESDPEKQAAMARAVSKYGNLDIEDNYRRLIEDLGSSDKEVQDNARSLIDYFDKMNLEAKYQKGQAAYQEEMRKSTMSKTKEGNSK